MQEGVMVMGVEAAMVTVAGITVVAAMVIVKMATTMVEITATMVEVEMEMVIGEEMATTKVRTEMVTMAEVVVKVITAVNWLLSSCN